MSYSLFSSFILIFLIIDPFGNIAIFANLLKNTNINKKTKIVLIEHAIAFFILLLFMFFGDLFLKALGLSNLSLQISGALILFLISIKMIFPDNNVNENVSNVDPFIVPLAIPSIAGPSAIATVMLLVSQHPEHTVNYIVSLFIAIAFSSIILIFALKFQDKIGQKFILAIEKLMGLILVSLSVEMMIRGIKVLFKL